MKEVSMIPRPFYLRKMIQARGGDFIKIITGIRRCGKSTLLRMFKDYLLGSRVPSDHIIEISYEKIDSLPLEDSASLEKYEKAASPTMAPITCSWMKYRSFRPGRRR